MPLPSPSFVPSSPADLNCRGEEQVDVAARDYRHALADAQALLAGARAPRAMLLAPMRIMASSLGLARARIDAVQPDEGLVLAAAGDLLVIADDPAREPVLRVACVRAAWQGLCAAMSAELIVESEAMERTCRHIAASTRGLRPVMRWLTGNGEDQPAGTLVTVQ